jgi:pimeloyl-ACP methyl ester carboxylesterase
MSETILGARLATIADTGHFNNLKAPEAFNAALGAFLEGLG